MKKTLFLDVKGKVWQIDGSLLCAIIGRFRTTIAHKHLLANTPRELTDLP